MTDAVTHPATPRAGDERAGLGRAAGPRCAADLDGAADLECDVAGLAMAYLGDRRPSELVATGWWTAHDEAAVARADRLFAADGAPWCGTYF